MIIRKSRFAKFRKLYPDIFCINNTENEERNKNLETMWINYDTSFFSKGNFKNSILYNNAKLKRGERRKEGKVTSIQNFLRDEFNRATSFLPGTNDDERQRHFWTSFSRTFRKLRVPRALITRRRIHPLASLCSANEWRVHYPRQTDKTMDEWTPFRAFRDYN